MKEKSAIMQMYYGQRGNAGKLKCTSEYGEIIDKANNCYKMLCEKLKDMPEILELLEKYNDYSADAIVLDVGEHYLEGFKFGLLIGIEAGESKFGE